MARRTIPPFSELWSKHETLYLGLFTIALQRLSDDKDKVVGEDENHLSERLRLILTDVCLNESKKCDCEIRPPDWEKPIPPTTVSELKGGKASKIPDFTCTLTNPHADNTEEYEISFHVECKRLGFPTSRSWKLNENYVINGIKRFDDTSHEYGERAYSGMMIGYIINMSPESILDEVNNYQKKHCSGNPDITYELNNKSVWQYSQNLKRKSLKPESFTLLHLWVNFNDDLSEILI